MCVLDKSRLSSENFFRYIYSCCCLPRGTNSQTGGHAVKRSKILPYDKNCQNKASRRRATPPIVILTTARSVAEYKVETLVTILVAPLLILLVCNFPVLVQLLPGLLFLAVEMFKDFAMCQEDQNCCDADRYEDLVTDIKIRFIMSLVYFFRLC